MRLSATGRRCSTLSDRRLERGAARRRRGRDSIWICRLGAGRRDRRQPADPPCRRACMLAEMIAAALAQGRAGAGRLRLPVRLSGRLRRAARARRARRGARSGTRSPASSRTDERQPQQPLRGRRRAQPSASRAARSRSGAGRRAWSTISSAPSTTAATTPTGSLEKRLIDTWMVGAQPCWKLIGAGSVGGQVLTGIPVVRALRDDPRWADRARIWPFETGFGVPDDARIVFAEVWPSWWKVVPRAGASQRQGPGAHGRPALRRPRPGGRAGVVVRARNLRRRGPSGAGRGSLDPGGHDAAAPQRKKSIVTDRRASSLRRAIFTA